ncbi:hypothetical protein C7C46_11720, partial [Streptomyces tateyamensis]
LLAAALAKQPQQRPAPQEFGQRLAALGAAGESGTVRLGRGGWLPPVLAEAVGRQAVELLELEGEQAVDAAAAPGRPGPASPAGRRRWPLLLAGAALVVGAGGGLLAVHPWSSRAGDTADGPSVSDTPSGAASDAASDEPSGKTPQNETPAAADEPSAGATPGAPPSPGPSTPDAVPAAFLGTWTGTDSTSTLGSLLGETTTVTVRPAALGAENTTSVNGASGGVLSVRCDGAWKLISAGATKLVFSSRLVRANPAGACSGGAAAEQLELQSDGTLKYTSTDGAAGNPTATLHKVG